MGKIKELIIEFSELLADLVWHAGSEEDAESELKNMISPDEFEFYLDNKDMIWNLTYSHRDENILKNESLDSEKGMNIPGPIVFAEMLEDQLFASDGDLAQAEQNIKEKISDEGWKLYLDMRDVIIDHLEYELPPEQRYQHYDYLDESIYVKPLIESFKRWSIKRVVDEKLQPIADSLGLELVKGKKDQKTVMSATKVTNQHYNIGNAHIVIQDVKVPGMGADNASVLVLDPGDDKQGVKFIGMNSYNGLEDKIKETANIPSDGNLRTPRYTDYTKSKLLNLIKDLRVGASDESDEALFDIVDGVFMEEDGLEEFIKKEMGVDDPKGWLVNQIV